MSELKEYEIYFNVGATQHVTVTANSPEEAVESADCYPSLCYHCSKDGLSIDEGDDFIVELDGETVLEHDNNKHQYEYIAAIQQQNTALQQQVKDLQAEKSIYVGVDFSKDYTAEIKAAAIRDAASELYVPDSHYYKIAIEYANTLSSKGGD